MGPAIGETDPVSIVPNGPQNRTHRPYYVSAPYLRHPAPHREPRGRNGLGTSSLILASTSPVMIVMLGGESLTFVLSMLAVALGLIDGNRVDKIIGCGPARCGVIVGMAGIALAYALLAIGP